MNNLKCYDAEGNSDCYANQVYCHSLLSGSQGQFCRFIQQGISKDVAINTIQTLVAEVISFDEEHAYSCAELINHTKPYGLSLGDRACISLGLAPPDLVETFLKRRGVHAGAQRRFIAAGFAIRSSRLERLGWELTVIASVGDRGRRGDGRDGRRRLTP